MVEKIDKIEELFMLTNNNKRTSDSNPQKGCKL